MLTKAIAAVSTAMLATSALTNAATITESNWWLLGSENDASADYTFRVAINSANAGFAGSVDKAVNESFDNPIDGYSFFYQSATNTIGSYTSSGTRVSIPTPLTGTGGNSSNLKLWTTTNPDSVAGAPVDYATTPNHALNTMVLTYNASGTIDISGLEQGTIYFFYGAYRNTPQFDFTMSGSGQTDIVLLDVGDNDFANNNEFYSYALDFDNTGDLYDTISYTFSIPEVNNGRGRLGGIVITAPIPEPASLAVLGLGGILVATRRRR